MADTTVTPTAEHGTRDQDPDEGRVLVGRFSRYKDAKRAVDRLRVARIPDRRISVLGRGIKWSPPVTAERAARLGGSLGILVGAVSTVLLWSLGALATGFSWLSATVMGGFVGGGVGVLLGILAWRVSRDTAKVPETGSVDVSRYELLVEPDDLPAARELLGD